MKQYKTGYETIEVTGKARKEHNQIPSIYGFQMYLHSTIS